MAIRHARIPAGTDFGSVLQGLPDDRCPSPHWGIVLAGALRLEHADDTVETAKAGEVYFWPAAHTATSSDGAVFIGIGPTAPDAPVPRPRAAGVRVTHRAPRSPTPTTSTTEKDREHP